MPPRARATKAEVVEYTSNPVDYPASFLSSHPSTAPTVSIHRVDFASTPLKERDGCYCVVLDNVLSKSECTTLLQYAEQSSTSKPNPWHVALVNVGGGREALVKDYRNSERIIWDDQVLMDRLWSRCLLAPGLKNDLVKLEGDEKAKVLGNRAKKNKFRDAERWEFARLNERMRFLRYEPGMFFREHCDGNFTHPDTGETSFYTLHLYLNDSIEGLEPEPYTTTTNNSNSNNSKHWLDSLNPFSTQSAEKEVPSKPGVELSGGSTAFYSDNMNNALDVFPRAGRVVIFQQRSLLHAGSDINAGVKYTMRTDLMYRQVFDDE